MTFIQPLFLSPRGCVCVCVCVCMIITLMFCAFWRDCVCIIESPPPALVVFFPLSSAAASEKPSSLPHLPYMLSFKPLLAHSPSFAMLGMFLLHGFLFSPVSTCVLMPDRYALQT